MGVRAECEVEGGAGAAGACEVAVVKKPFWDPVFVGEFTTHFSRDFSGDWDVHWGYGLNLDPWPSVARSVWGAIQISRILLDLVGSLAILWVSTV